LGVKIGGGMGLGGYNETGMGMAVAVGMGMGMAKPNPYNTHNSYPTNLPHTHPSKTRSYKNAKKRSY